MKKLALAAVAALVAFPAFADQQRDSVAKNLIAMGNIIDVFGYACNLSDGDREAAGGPRALKSRCRPSRSR